MGGRKTAPPRRKKQRSKKLPPPPPPPPPPRPRRAHRGAALPARAEDGQINIQFFKAGWVIGGSYGKGVMSFRGEQYLLEVGGLSYGFTFGGSQTSLSGRVRNIRRATDVNGVYGAGSAGAAVGKGGQVIV